MPEEDYKDWTVDECEKCNRLLQEFDYMEHEDELPTKWMCIGRIIKPNPPKNEHDEYNEIRICLQGSDEIQTWEWTPFEASRVGLGLTFAATDFLLDLQPDKDLD